LGVSSDSPLALLSLFKLRDDILRCPDSLVDFREAVDLREVVDLREDALFALFWLRSEASISLESSFFSIKLFLDPSLSRDGFSLMVSSMGSSSILNFRDDEFECEEERVLGSRFLLVLGVSGSFSAS